MQYIQIHLKQGNDLIKTWHLAKSKDTLTIGSSRNCDIQIPSLNGIQGGLTWHQNHWVYSNFDLSANGETADDIVIKKSLAISKNGLDLHIIPYEDCKKYFTHQAVPIDPSLVEKVQKINPKEYVSKNTLVGAGVLIFGLISAIVASHSVAKKNAADNIAIIKHTAPIVVSEINIKKPLPKAVQEKKEKKDTPTVDMAKAERKPASRGPGGFGGQGAFTNGSGNMGPSTSIVNGDGGARLSSLIGKVAARNGNSKNVVIAFGKKAGEGQTSRALSIGGGSKPDIGSFGLATGASLGGVKIATIGRGGGNGGMVNLSSIGNGKIGTGAIDLIEEETEVAGGLDKEVIAQNIKSRLGQVLYCYERQLSANPKLMGKVSVKFTIGSEGDVVTQQVNQTTLNNSFVETCILQKIAKWKFPAPQGGTQVNVVYPFLFKTTE